MATHPDVLIDLPPRPHVPARQVLLSAVALWLTYFLLITVRGVVVDLGEFHELLWRRALVTVAGIIITLLAWPVLRRFDGRSSGVRIAAALAIMLPAALALAAINQQAFAPVEQKLIEREASAARQQVEMATRAVHAEQNAAGRGVAPVPALPGMRVRRDVSGNVLIDVSDPPLAPLRQAPVELPAQPAPPQAPRPPKFPPPPGQDGAAPLNVGQNAAGSPATIAPGGVSIVRRADGTAEIRVGNRLVVTDADHADDVADDLEDVQRDHGHLQAQAQAQAEADARRNVEDGRAAEIEALHRDLLRSLADQGLIPQGAVPPEPAVEPASAPHQAHDGHAASTRQPSRQPSRQPPPEPLPAAPPTSAGATSAETAVSVAAVSDTGPQLQNAIIHKMVENEGLWRQLTDVALGRYFLLIAWAALYLALGNAEMVRASERREGEYKRAAKAAELRSLRYQVNPHFLFNTLNSLSALVMTQRSEQAEKMIQTISSFYRHSLAGDPGADVPLADELALQRHYLEIEAVRFPERLVCEFDVPPSLENACVPGMLLQPLVENSIKYGVSASTRPVTIRIAAEEAGGVLVLTVADDGPGKGGQASGTGIGLANVRSRLAARFGAAARVESGPLPAGGYATVLTIPLVRAGCD